MISDAEFGLIPIRRVKGARHARLRIGPNGTLSATLPKRAPVRLIRELLDESRTSVRLMIEVQPPVKPWRSGDSIGASHVLQIIPDQNVAASHSVINGNVALIRHHPTLSDTQLQTDLRKLIKKALRVQAKAYLPRRLDRLAEEHGFYYERLRFSSAKTRWGSCSSSGTLSLNVSLMSLPLELVDYVLIHELCHTRHMNHSKAFWQLVEQCLENYKQHRKAIKRYTPGIY